MMTEFWVGERKIAGVGLDCVPRKGELVSVMLHNEPARKVHFVHYDVHPIGSAVARVVLTDE